MTVRLGRYEANPDWGQIVFASAIGGWIVWYYFDALAASPHIQNMLLIRPATIISLIVYACIVIPALRIRPRSENAQASEPDEPRPPMSWRPAGIAFCLLAYVAALPFAGFDVATFAFVALAMMVSGERRWWFAVLFAAIFAGALSLAFRFALAVPVPTLVF